MAKEIQIVTDTSGQTLYAQVFRATDGKVWNTAGTPAFEDYATANIADYDIALTEQGTASKIYMGTFPSGIAAGDYLVRVLIRAGGSPAETDALAGAGPLHWDGSTVIDVTTVHANLLLAMGATFNTSTDSLEAIRNQGDAAWVTATGFSTHSASDVWAVGTRTLTAGTNIQLPSDGLANITAWTVAITGNITGDLSGSVGSVTALTNGSIADAVWEEAIADHSGTAGSTAEALDAASAGASSPADIADAVWDEAMAGHNGAGTFGVQVSNTIDAILEDTETTLQGELDGIQADTEDIQSRLPAALVSGRMDSTIDATGMESGAVANIVAGIGLTIATGTIGTTGNSTTALHLAGLTFGDDELNNLLIVIRDVSESEYHARWITDWADTGDLATVATLPFTPQNSTDTYVILAVRQDVTGGGGLDAAGVRAAIGLASANLDTQLGTIDTTADAILVDTNELQTDWANGGRLDLILDARASQTSVDDLPTNAELATALAGADDATLAAIAALNNLSAAQVNAEVDTALADIKLDHLLHLAVDTDYNTTVHQNSVIGYLGSTGNTYDRSTDSQEAIRNRGDTAWVTATGFATAANLATVAGYLDTEIAAILEDTGTTLPAQISALNNLSAAQVNAEVDTALADVGLTTTVTGRIDVAISSRGTGVALDAAGVRTAVGLASANLDTQIASLASTLSTILADTNELQTDWVNGGRLDLLLDSAIAAIAALNNLSAAQVNAEVLDVLATDTHAEPSAVPAATASLKDKIGWLAALARNKITQTATTQTVLRDDGSTTMATSTHSDDGTTHTRGEFS